MPALAIVLPLLVAAALAGATRVLGRRTADLVAVAAALATTALAVALAVRAGDGRVVSWVGGWEPRGGLAIGIALVADRASATLATAAGVLTTAALAFSWRWFDAVGTLFHALMLVFLAALAGFCLSGDLFTMFVFFELMGVAGYALAGYKHEEPGPIQGALNFAVTNSLGGLLLLIGTALLYGRAGALNLAQLGQALAASPPDTLVVTAFSLLAAGFLVKAAVVPFHFWLADAYSVAPTPVSVLFAGIMSELGLYGLARVYWTVFAPAGVDAGTLRATLVGAGVVTALLGALMCVLQDRLPRLLAYATVSHAGITLIGLGLLDAAALAGALLYLVADGLVKAGLFIGIGVVVHKLGTASQARLRGRRLRMPLAVAVLAAGAAGLAGLPPAGTWLAKAMMEEAAAARGLPWVTAVLVVASALTAAAVVRVIGRVLGLGPAPAAAEPDAGDDEPELRTPRRRTPPVLLVPGAALLVGALALGVVPGAPQLARAAALDLRDSEAYAAAVLGGGAAPAPHPGGHHWPAHPATAVATGLLTAALAVAVGLGALRAHPRVWRPARGAVARLRQAHSGHPGDSVAWLTLGTALLGLVFIAFLR